MGLTPNALFAIVVLMGLTWLASLALRDASIIDLVWGFGFVVVGSVTWLTNRDPGPLQNLTLALVTIWGLRLTIYLSRRNLGHGEDFRYQAMRRQWGPRFPLVSLITVFALQGAIMWVVSLPGQVINGTTMTRRSDSERRSACWR